MSFWTGKRVLVTGGSGFLGSHVVNTLRGKDCSEIIVVKKKEYDLTKEDQVRALFEKSKPHIVFHLAGLVGGILPNKERPAEFFYVNLMVGTLMLHYSWLYKVEKFTAAGAGCGYPEHAPIPLKEESFWNGFPQKESAPYSLAKRLLHIQSVAYRQQHGFNSIICIPGNIYGRYDNFNLLDAHVIPALVRKFVEASRNKSASVEVWGSGKPTRDFVYAGDVADGMIRATEVYDKSEIINISSGVETSIREVVQHLTSITGFSGEVY
ncbi:MAG: NAD-dependent epimerase/dehydratase family protein, partial [Ignavibacteriae bacterium]|nr:NAD-dependent epimerase/dehydratase family protein [Ignavibacteriota bacterium]